jgi:hypothetical protein
MRLRRTLLLIVALCLLLSQQAALAHGISHIVVGDDRARAAPTSLQKLAADHADEFCVECLAFAQVMGAACDTTSDAPAVGPAAFTASAVVDTLVAAGPLLAFRARAPPFTR